MKVVWRLLGLSGVLLVGAAVVSYLLLFETVPPPAVEVSLPADGFSYDALDDVLSRFVDEEGRVDYAALAADRASLDRFLAQIAHTGPKTTPRRFPSDDDRLAYYINAYNAVVLANVLRMDLPRSVHDDKYDFFYLTRFFVDGSPINLYDLENKVVRKKFKEPRVHFALNCASVGCPKLPRAAFRSATLDDALARETERFLGEARNVTLTDDGTLKVSQIFQWYADDFPPNPRAWILEHRPDLDVRDGAPLTFRRWDWSLNAQP